jgi:hypothetical protein
VSSTSSSSADAIFRLVRPADEADRRRLSSADMSASGAPTAYTVLIYTELPLGIAAPTNLPPNCPAVLSELPLAGAVRLEIGWSSYDDYLADFLLGEKAPEAMRGRLLRALSPDFGTVAIQLFAQPIRVWISSECPELDDLPWELLLGDPAVEEKTDLSVVRGLPAQRPRPVVPLQRKPRLALIGWPPYPPVALWDRLRALQNVDVVPLSGSPRQALRQAAAESFELVHLVADAFITQAYEAALYFHDLPGTEPAGALTVSELGAQLLASQVAVLGLSVPDYEAPDVMTLAGRQVPSAYRAYARLGVAEPSLPTMVAPIGPLDPPKAAGLSRLANFWGEFYEGLGDSFNVEEGMRRARNSVKAAPMALFLRHPNGRLFRRARAESPQVAAEVAHKSAEYALSLRLTERLQTLHRGMGDFSKNVAKLLEEESGNQQKIAGELEQWTSSEE